MSDQQLRTRIWETLEDEWKRGKTEDGVRAYYPTLESKDIHTRLEREGVNVPEGAMEEVFEELEESGLVTVAPLHDRQEIPIHGAMLITPTETTKEYILS